MSLYRVPELYEALRSPPPAVLGLVRRLIGEHLGGVLRSVMDPACGPGTWLAPFAGPGVMVAGNDLLEEMVLRCRERFAEGVAGAEFTLGDMRSLAFERGPFDVTLEASGTVSYLREPGELRRVVASMASHTRPGGLVILNLFLESGVPVGIEGPMACPEVVTYESAPVGLLSGGVAWIRYSIVRKDRAAGLERIRRRVRTEGARGLPAVVEEEYDLRLWRVDEVNGVLDGVPGVRLVAVHEVPEWGTTPHENGVVRPVGVEPRLPEGVRDEHVIVLRRE